MIRYIDIEIAPMKLTNKIILTSKFIQSSIIYFPDWNSGEMIMSW